MSDIEEIIEIITAFDWEGIESKNPHMISFTKQFGKDLARLNYYFTGTVQIQERRWSNSSYIARNVTPTELTALLKRYDNRTV